MSHLPQRQKPALAQTRGELRAYQTCRACQGSKGVAIEGAGWYPCQRCGGEGRHLTDAVSMTRARLQARDARNTALDNHGRQPYD